MGTVSAAGTRTFDFTITGGEDVLYDAENPYCDADLADPFDEHIGGTKVDNILSFFGVKAFISSIYNWIMTYLEPIFKLVSAIKNR